MNAAGAPRHLAGRQPMLVVDPRLGRFADASVDDLADVLRAGDVVVLNDAATAPASLRVRAASGREHELRISGPPEHGLWSAVVLGPGDWRIDTDARPAPEPLHPGDELTLDDGARAVVVQTRGHRRMRFSLPGTPADQWRRVMQHGRPIQYSYASRDLRLADVQTRFASRPWAVEMPSAARPTSVQTVVELQQRGVDVVPLTHAAGLSATGSSDLDHQLPWRERFEIPPATADAVNRARSANNVVLAIGTSVVRALEGSAAGASQVHAGRGHTDLVIDGSYRPTVVTGLLSGVHEPATSHANLLDAFAPSELWQRARTHAANAGYLIHEFGDATLVLPGSLATAAAA